MNVTWRQSLLTTSLIVLGLMTTPGFAQSLDPVDESPVSDGTENPTPIEEFSPGEEGQVIPGTEPLYDKGITVTQLEITGNQLVPAETILGAMTTKPGSLYSKRRLQSDLRKIFDLGYFTEKLRVVPIATREGVHLKIELEENPVVERVEFDGESVIPEADLAKIFADQLGMPQNVNAINKGIQEVEALYKGKGYILARVEDIQEPEHGVVKLVVNEGKVGKITFTGNKKTKSNVIRRALAQKEGEVYNETVVTDDMKRVFGLQSFADVRRVIKASTDQPGTYDLAIEVDEKKTGAISLGGGVDTAFGLFGSVGYSDPNFMGKGQNFSTVFSVGSGALGANNVTLRRTVTQFQTSWFNPSLNDTNNSLGVNLYARQLGSFNVPLSIESRIGSTVTWSKPLERWLHTSTSLGLGVERVSLRDALTLPQLQDRIKRASGGTITRAQREDQMDDGTFVYLDPAVAFDTRDNRLNPSSGWLNTVNSRLAAGIGADSYGTVGANLRRYLKVTDDVTFALNAQAGSAVFGDIPGFNQYRLGGAYTVRGFQEGGMGIGEGFLLGSAEIRSKLPFLKRFNKRMPLYDMVQVALFADAGTLLSEDESNELFDRPGDAVALGAGLRLNLPSLGPIRIDWAVPIGGAGSQRRNFNFGVGQKF